ncbi:trypsin-like peptidase domain-containing protein [Streptomyces caatingaensis]|uniref:nSTAND1 domain-containing NTPase n=1 Tax=Streptomyces caatingaensis TaxID=1678637 RepID=UPI0006727820|nr:trypsin-like peptidase domain-containing protein [Streptomyces caatingaensis]
MSAPAGSTAGTGPKALDAALLRIRDAHGAAVGVGFLVTEDRALTCAHVVSAALGPAEGTPPYAAARVTVDLPLLPGPAGEAAVEHWVAPTPSGTGDVAVLRLDGPLPGSRPIRLVEAEDVWGHPVRAFGFPAGRPGGVWHSGVLRSRQANGWVQADLAGQGYRIAQGFSGGPVWDDGLVGVIGMVTVAEAGDPPAGYLIPTGGLLAAWPPLRGLTLPPSPFRGLAPFQEADAALFHGRDAETSELAAMLAHERWTTLVGPSGSGKSSLALAGVVPRLRASGIRAAAVRPASGRSPVSALAAALLPLLEPESTATQQLERTSVLAGVLRRDGMADVVPRILDRHSARRLLVVVDQFEELLSLAPAAVDELAGILFHDSLPHAVRVLTTLRADFLEEALAHPGLGPLCGRRLYALGPMDADRLREVVTVPVDAVPGLRYEPHLVDRILAGTGGEPGALALLGFTLDLLWRHQAGGLLTHRAYEELGGVSGALGRHADRVWGEYVPPEDEAAARRLFTRLVRVPLGSAAATRRTVPRLELDAGQWRIARELARTRLLVTDRGPEGHETVELAHEALITGWGRLRDWTDEDRAFLVWRESLRHDMDHWERGGRATDLLPTAAALTAARPWLRDRAADLSAAERAYLERGRAQRRRRTLRRRAVLAVICVLALLATGVGVLAVRLREDAADKAAVVRASRLVAEAEAARAADPGIAAQLAVAAHRSARTPETAAELYTALRTPLDSVVGATGQGVLRVAAQPDGPLAAAVDRDGQLRIWDLTTPLAPVLRATLRTAPTGIALGPRGRRLLASDCQGGPPGVCLWDLTTPRHPTVAGRLPWPVDSSRKRFQIGSMAFNSDGTLLAAATQQGPVLVWSTESPATPRLVTRLQNPTSSDGLAAVAFSPRGNTLAATILNGRTQLWNLSTPSAPTRAAVIDTGYSAIAFSHDGTMLSAVKHTDIGLWNTSNPSKPRVIKVESAGTRTNLMATAFSADGRKLAVSGVSTRDSNSELCLLSVPSGPKLTASPACARTGYSTVALAPTTGGALLSGGSDGMVRLWRSPVPEADDAEVHSTFKAWAFSPDGRLMAAPVTTADTTSKGPRPSPLGVWDRSAPAGPVRVATVTLPDTVQDVMFLRPSLLLSVAHNGSVQVWSLRDPRRPVQVASLGTASFIIGRQVLGADLITGTGVAATHSGDLVSVQGADRRMHLWHVSESGEAAESGSVPLPDRRAGFGVALQSGGTAMIVAASAIEWWDISNPAHPVRGGTTALSGAMQGIVVSARDAVVVATPAPAPFHDGRTLHLLHAVAGKVLSSVTLPGTYGDHLGMSDDGRRLIATGTGDNTVSLWDITDPAHPAPPVAMRTLQDVEDLTIDEHGRRMAVWNLSFSQSSSIQLWDISDRTAPVLSATIPRPGLYTAVALPQDRTLLVADGNAVFSFDTSPSDVADLLCSYTGNSLTTEQWKKYAPGLPRQEPCS